MKSLGMFSGNRSFLFGLASIFLTTSNLAAVADSKLYGSVSGWQVAYDIDRSSCSAFSQPNGSGTSLGLVWDYRSSVWSIGLFNESWNLKVGQRIPGRAYVDRDFLVERRMDVVSRHMIVLPISKNDTGESNQVFSELGDGNELRILWSGGTETRFALNGSRAALHKIAECAGKFVELAKEQSATKKEARVASYNFEIVPREQALVLVTNMLSRAGITGFEILPAKPDDKHQNVVYYQTNDGRLGWFSASRGSTLSADDYASRVFGERSRLCPQTIGGRIHKVPATDGTVIRRIEAVCDAGAASQIYETFIARKPDGFLIDLSSLVVIPRGLREDAPDREQATDGLRLLDAALLLAVEN